MPVWVKNPKNLSKDDCEQRVIDQGKDRKRDSKKKWTDREYYVQDDAYIAHKYVKMYCDTNQFPTLPFFGSHPKPYGERGLGKHYHIRFDSNIGNGICKISRIPCACVGCTSILEKHWIYGIPSQKYSR